MPLTVNELARQAGVPSHVVRFYTREGLLRPRRNPANRYRLYRDSDVTRLRFIRRAKFLGFTLGDITQILRDADRGQSPCPKAREIIVGRLEDAEDRLSALAALHERMRRAAKKWRTMPDALPTGRSICHLVEAVTDDVTLDRAIEGSQESSER